MKNRNESGFTLLEMMLAITIFSVLSLSAVMIFKGVLKNSEITQRKSTQLVQLQRALAVMERDFSHALTRTPSHVATQPGTPEFSVRQVAEGSRHYQVMLIRKGWHNPDARLPRSTLERVEYRLQAGRLERLSYPRLNSPLSSARSVTLLSEVLGLRLRFFHQGEWIKVWQASSFLPQAVEITLETPSFGSVRRIVLLAVEDKS